MLSAHSGFVDFEDAMLVFRNGYDRKIIEFSSQGKI